MLAVVNKAELLDFGLALGAALPTALRTFVAPDVDELRGEDVAELAEDGLEEGHGLRVSGAEDFAAAAPLHLERPDPDLQGNALGTIGKSNFRPERAEELILNAFALLGRENEGCLDIPRALP